MGFTTQFTVQLMAKLRVVVNRGAPHVNLGLQPWPGGDGSARAARGDASGATKGGKNAARVARVRYHNIF